jgi:hypothetical protein
VPIPVGMPLRRNSGESAIIKLMRAAVVLLGFCVAASTVSACSSKDGSRTRSSTPTLGTETPPSRPPSSEPANGAVRITLSATDRSAIGNDYAQATAFNQCAVEPVPGQLKAAVISATGVAWAFGTMEPDCRIVRDGQRISPSQMFPFGAIPDNAGVFEKQPGGAWHINWVESDPFPCPPVSSRPDGTPGPGSPMVPLAVLNAVGVSYAPGCDHVYIPTLR